MINLQDVISKFTFNDPMVNLQLLPKELQDNILLQLLKVKLCPGKIFQNQSPDGYGVYQNGDSIMEYPPPDVSIFRALDRYWATKAMKMLYSDNTWVMEEGEVHGRHFLTPFPQHTVDRIVSVEIRLSWRDVQWTQWLGDWQTFLQRSRLEAEHAGEELDVNAARQRYNQDMADYRLWMLDVWQAKLIAIINMPLLHLKLDFITACDLGGKFQGTRFASRFLPRFTHGVPESLEIVTPRRGQEHHIRGIIMKKHRPRPRSRRMIGL